MVVLTKMQHNVSNMIDPDTQTQMCGMELTVDKVEEFVGAGILDFDNSSRTLSPTIEVRQSEGLWFLDAGTYLITFREKVKIPKNACAIAQPRSSLLRMGVTMGTALWDPGYEGRGQSLLIVHNPYGFWMKENARLVQLVFLKLESEATKLYNGRYQGV